MTGPFDLLRRTGEALYGERWQAPLARDLGVSDRQMRRWAAGSHTPPEGVWTDLAAIVAARRIALAEIRKRLVEAVRAPA